MPRSQAKMEKMDPPSPPPKSFITVIGTQRAFFQAIVHYVSNKRRKLRTASPTPQTTGPTPIQICSFCKSVGDM